MNEELQAFARDYIKEGLAKCTEKEQTLFKNLYSYDNVDGNINIVVDRMKPEQLDWAMQQVKRTLQER